MEVREPSTRRLTDTDIQLTEVGALPKDWSVVPLTSLAEKIMVGIASAATHAYRSTGVTMFRNQNIRPGLLDTQDVLYIDPHYELTYKNKRLKAGDLLTARTGYPGTTSLVPAGFDGAQSFTTLITRPRPGSVDRQYLCLYINGRAGQRYFEQAQIGGGQKNVNAASLKLLPVALPSTDTEQRAIARALTDADALIDSLEQLLTKKRQIKQGAMQELLTGKRRLPGFTGMVQTIDLGSVCKMQSGGTPAASQPAYFDGPHPWVAISDITKADKYLVLTERSLSDAGLNACAAQLFPAGTVLYAMYASVGECCIAAVAVCTSQAILAIQPSRNLDPEYLYYSLTSSKAKAKSAVQQGTQGNLNKGIVQAMEIRLPEVAEQKAIARALSDIDEELAAIDSRLSKARALKQAMAQALLTGRIRLLEPAA